MSNSKIISIIKDHCYNLTKLRIALGTSISEDDFMEACIPMKDLQSIDIDLKDCRDPENPFLQNNHILDNIPDNISEIFLTLEYRYSLYCSLVSFNELIEYLSFQID